MRLFGTKVCIRKIPTCMFIKACMFILFEKNSHLHVYSNLYYYSALKSNQKVQKTEMTQDGVLYSLTPGSDLYIQNFLILIFIKYTCGGPFIRCNNIAL